MPRAEFEPTIPVTKRPRPKPHTERPLGSAIRIKITYTQLDQQL
jgi:hypothetical protein